MSVLSGWLTVLAIGIVAVVTPGPDFALTLRNSLAYSRRAGVYTAVGVGAGNLVHAAYSLVGIGAIIAQSIVLFNLLKGLGAAYLVYVGIKSLLARKSAAVENVARQRDISPWAAFRIGFFGNLLNPKATLFFLALFTQLVQPATPLLVQALYGATTAGLALVWFTGVALLISQPLVRTQLVRCSHWIERVTGALLIALGLRLAVAKAE
ncbi:MAG TPA: LysE family transporter [Trichocoleus sp.]